YFTRLPPLSTLFPYTTLFRSHFTLLSWTDGRFMDERGRPLAGPPRDWGFSVMLRDIDGDGVPDIYVCNDFWSPDRIWLNDGKGRSEEHTSELQSRFDLVCRLL